MEDRAAYRTNQSFRNHIDILIVTDGKNHVLDRLHDSYTNSFTEVVLSF